MNSINPLPSSLTDTREAGPGPSPAPWLDRPIELRADLQFDLRSNQDSDFVIIEDPVRSKFFQVGAREFEFIALIDGQRTAREILNELNCKPDESGACLDDAFATPLCQWLIQTNLTVTNTTDNEKRFSQQAEGLRRAKLVGLINPISFKFNLLNPHRALGRLLPFTQWAFSTWFFVIWMAVGIYAFGLIITQWDRLGDASTGILSGNSWIWLLIVWAGLKLIHETAHGVACRRYGGDVPEAGVLFLLFTPMAYVNVTSMWRFSSRWHRIVVSAAGMYAELFISFVAVIVWTNGSGLVADLAFKLFLMSSVTTVLFNANPLMRFDGYFLLSDILAIPNLYSKGTHWFGDRVKCLIFGTAKTPNLCAKHELRRVAVYGTLAFFWKISISVSLIIGAGVLFQGAGLVLSIFGIGIWFGLPIVRQIRILFGKNSSQPVHPVRILTRCCIAGLFGFFLFSFLKAPAIKSAPAMVQFSDESVVRAGADGFICQILVGDGEAVKAGQTLIELDNPELLNEVTELQLLANESKIQSRIHRQAREFSLAIAESKKHDELVEQLIEKTDQANGLKIVAPFDGFVFKRNLKSQMGKFAHQGDALLNMAKRQSKEIVVSIDQQDLESIRHHAGKTLLIAFPGQPVLRTVLTRIDPVASQTPVDESMCATWGGPLSVRPVATGANPEGPKFELLSPRFNATLTLDESTSRPLSSGQRGRAFFSTCRQSLGSYCYLAARDWLESKIKHATQNAAF